MSRAKLAPLAFAVLVSAIASRASADDAAMEEARKHFKAGVAYLEDPDGARFEEAYGEFKKAYEISKSAKVLGNLALTAMKLERDAEAIEAFSRYLEEVPDIDADERAQSVRDMQTLIASAVHVRITLDIRDNTKPTAIVFN